MADLDDENDQALLFDPSYHPPVVHAKAPQADKIAGQGMASRMRVFESSNLAQSLRDTICFRPAHFS